MKSMTHSSFQPSPLGVKPLGITTSGTTVTYTESIEVQPLGLVTVSTNHMLCPGSAVGLAAEALLTSESGDQLKVEPGGPLGEPPSAPTSWMKMVWSGPASATGGSRTVISTWSEDEHGPSVTVRV